MAPIAHRTLQGWVAGPAWLQGGCGAYSTTRLTHSLLCPKVTVHAGNSTIQELVPGTEGKQNGCTAGSEETKWAVG